MVALEMGGGLRILAKTNNDLFKLLLKIQGWKITKTDNTEQNNLKFCCAHSWTRPISKHPYFSEFSLNQSTQK